MRQSKAMLLIFTFTLAVILLKPVSTARSQSGDPDTSTPFPATPTKPGGVVIQWSNFIYLPIIRVEIQSTSTATPPPPTPTAPPAPAYTYSRYMSTVSYSVLGDLGQERGGCLGTGTLAPADGFLVLNFGHPWNNGVTYGVVLYNAETVTATVSKVENGLRGFITEYYYCVRDKPNTFLTLAAGVNNSGPEDLTNYGHGRAWALMVNRLNDYIDIHTPSWGNKIQVVGAMDFEPDWNPAANARAWADGYDSADDHPYYNFGTCDGCPTQGFVSNHPINNGWTLDDLWYVSYGVQPAYPVPEIYNIYGIDAQKWQTASLYAATCTAPCEPHAHGNSRMFFPGVMTQQQACLENGCDPSIRNTPQQGWQQLWQALQSDSQTSQLAIWWLTDISWTK